MSKNPWHTKEWKLHREKLLNEDSVCELCGSKDDLHIHHPNSKNAATIRQEVWEYIYHQFNTWYKSVYPTKEEIENFSTTKCGKRGEAMHKHEGCITWHYVSTKHKKCEWYNYSNNLQKRREFTNKYREYDYKRWHDLYDEYKTHNHDTIQSIINQLIGEENKKYTDFEDIQVLCKKCHLAHHKGMDLCPVCKKKYKKKQYKTCYDCIPEDVKNREHSCFHCKKKPAKKREDGYYECDECYAGYKEFEKRMDDIHRHD